MTRTPDCGFRIGGHRKFFLEAKKPTVFIKEEIPPAYQIRRYAGNAKLPFSILSDIEEFAVYHGRAKGWKRKVGLTAADQAPWDWRVLVNGHGDKLLYERGAIATNLPLAELKARGHINARAMAAGAAADFSRRLRQGVPGMEP